MTMALTPRYRWLLIMGIIYKRIAGLPKLAWVAEVDLRTNACTLRHGEGVETRAEWAVEGVWDAPFENGAFHQSENFFGSGMRQEGGRLYFVPSTAVTDRLLWAQHGQRLVVTNSLPLLLAFLGAKLDAAHDYTPESLTILLGLRAYDRRFHLIHPDIDVAYQLFHDRLVVEDGKVTIQTYGHGETFATYEQYVARLRGVLAALAENYRSPHRRQRFSSFTTISSGYDSTAVVALVRDLGIDACFGSVRSNTPLPRWMAPRVAVDNGLPNAERLGMRCQALDDRKSQVTEDELFFLAPTTADPEIIFHSLARHIAESCDAAVVFTGYHGDKVWERTTPEHYLGEDIIRGDTSGLNLSEIRLQAGFIHVPVPLILAQSIRSLVAISRSDAMRPWRLDNSYDRPIPRRIAETAGLARESFGMVKKAVTKHYAFPRNRALRRKFFHFLERPEIFGHAFAALNQVVFRARRAWLYATVRDRRMILQTYTPRVVFWKDVDFRNLMFVWANQVLAERFTRALHAALTRDGERRHHEIALPSFQVLAD
jgi:hypothetical protein